MSTLKVLYGTSWINLPGTSLDHHFRTSLERQIGTSPGQSNRIFRGRPGDVGGRHPQDVLGTNTCGLGNLNDLFCPGSTTSSLIKLLKSTRPFIVFFLFFQFFSIFHFLFLFLSFFFQLFDLLKVFLILLFVFFLVFCLFHHYWFISWILFRLAATLGFSFFDGLISVLIFTLTFVFFLFFLFGKTFSGRFRFYFLNLIYFIYTFFIFSFSHLSFLIFFVLFAFIYDNNFFSSSFLM